MNMEYFRFSGGPSKMMEQRSESVMTSSSISYQSSGFYPSDYNRPRSGGSKSPLTPGIHKTPLEDAVIKEMSSKMSEMREESSQSFVTSTSEQKWEYVGQGIWENGEKHNNSFDRKKPVSAGDSLNLATSYHQSSRHKASSATQELDDLMQSLNTFKLGKSEEPVSTNLDVELENLQDVLKKQGVTPLTQKGICAACERPIVGQVVTALGKTFHPEHFTCAHCNMVCFLGEIISQMLSDYFYPFYSFDSLNLRA